MFDDDCPLDRSRRRVGWVLAGLIVLAVGWKVTPGIPVLWAPSARAEQVAEGRMLFEHEWTQNDPLAGEGDGLGPVFNARSCVECHFQGGVGGGGPASKNVDSFEIHPTASVPAVQAGVVHAFAVAKQLQEKQSQLALLFPVVPGGAKVRGACNTIERRDFDPVRRESLNPTPLFGAGWIDRISTKTIVHNHLKRELQVAAKEFELDFAQVPPGRPRRLPDGRIGKFGWKAQFASLEDFVAAACAVEVGLGNPRQEQSKPLGQEEYPPVSPDLNARQFAALVAYVDTLPRPVQQVPPAGVEQAAVARGETVFRGIGCALCHTPDLAGVKGVYSDFLLHVVIDRKRDAGSYGPLEPEVPLPDEHPRPEEWKTPPLWGVADSAPYFHDGGSLTLESAILRHAGHAAPVTKAYQGLPTADKQAVIAFLRSLRAPPAATPSPARLDSRLVSR